MTQAFVSNPKFVLSHPLRVGVICGGQSAERVISRRSGKAVQSALRRAGYRVSTLDPARPNFKAKLRDTQIAFITLHGEGGEDGAIQRLLQRQKIPYLGSDILGCQRSFDKAVAKRLFIRHKIPTPSFEVLSPRNWKKARLRWQGKPVFLKPLSEGSSIGTFGVEDFTRSAVKIKRALDTYKRLLVEEKIIGREFTVGILGKKALPVVELKPKRAFYDYRAKYTQGMTRYLVPATLDPKLARKLQRIALKVHQTLKLRDLSRVDIMMDKANQPFVLEVNTIPGFTQFSLLPKAASVIGISFESLCDGLVQMVYRRAQKRGIKV